MPEHQPQFGRLPFQVISTGYLTGLSKSQVKVYMALCSHAGPEWTAAVGNARIAELAGLTSDRQVRRITHQLQEYGLIRIEDRRGRSNVNLYRIITDPDPPPTTATENRTQRDVRFSPPENRTSDHKTGHPETENRTFSPQKPDTKGCPGNRGTEEHIDGGRKPDTPAGPTPQAAAAADALVSEFGFEPRDARQLVTKHGPDAADRAIRNAHFLADRKEIKTTPRKYIVSAIKGNWSLDDRLAKADQRKANESQAAARRQQEAQTKAQKDAAEIARQQEAKDRLDGMTPEDREQFEQECLAACKARHKNPRSAAILTRDSQSVRAEMFRRLTLTQESAPCK